MIVHYLSSAYIVELLKLTAWHNKCYGMKKVLARQGIRIAIRIVSIFTHPVLTIPIWKSLVCDISIKLPFASFFFT